jgi:hypothetical protein
MKCFLFLTLLPLSVYGKKINTFSKTLGILMYNSYIGGKVSYAYIYIYVTSPFTQPPTHRPIYPYLYLSIYIYEYKVKLSP